MGGSFIRLSLVMNLSKPESTSVSANQRLIVCATLNIQLNKACEAVPKEKSTQWQHSSDYLWVWGWLRGSSPISESRNRTKP